MIYQIKIDGVLEQTRSDYQTWSNWLGDIDIHTERTEDNGVVTTLVADLVDQAALFGILDYIRDLNLVLISVNPQGPGRWANMTETQPDPGRGLGEQGSH